MLRRCADSFAVKQAFRWRQRARCHERSRTTTRRAEAQLRWFHLTPGRCPGGLLAVEGLLWLSERFGWLPWHKGYAVLTAVAVVAAALAGDAPLVRRCPALPLAVPVQHPVAAGAGRRRRHPVQLAGGGDEEGEETEGHSRGDHRGWRLRLL